MATSSLEIGAATGTSCPWRRVFDAGRTRKWGTRVAKQPAARGSSHQLPQRLGTKATHRCLRRYPNRLQGVQLGRRPGRQGALFWIPLMGQLGEPDTDLFGSLSEPTSPTSPCVQG